MYIKTKKFLYNKQCVLNCPEGYFENYQLQQCIPCASECRTCNGAKNDNCLTCKSGTFLLNTTCVISCPSRKFPNKNNGKCDYCHSACLNCIGESYM